MVSMGFQPSVVSCTKASLNQQREASHLTRVLSCGL